ncbi:GNAT family N-acetyltransferase [Lacibacterium aquatile]|uniref:GNAT family N-acetyltransferase n=1 Tax=Lacibacterium aquatile TaxID=1168082 RepID=A0ABW5DV52_9PROT
MGQEDVEYRFAGAVDAASVAALLRALDSHYLPEKTHPSKAVYLAMVGRVFDSREGTRFVLAIRKGKPVGIACIAILRPGNSLKGLIYVKDLFVVEAARSIGIGRGLMGFLASLALAKGIGRIELATDTDNQGARRLYEALGASKPEKIAYRFEVEAMKRMADPDVAVPDDE